jgi:hypothetical protein
VVVAKTPRYAIGSRPRVKCWRNSIKSISLATGDTGATEGCRHASQEPQSVRSRLEHKLIAKRRLMKTTRDRPRGDPHLAKNMAKSVSFYCLVIHIQRAGIMGDFNGWDTSLLPMELQVDSSGHLQKPLTHVHQGYLFLIVNVPMLDSIATGTTRNERNELVSLTAAS